MTRPRRSGGRWRLLLHNIGPRGTTGVAHSVQSHPDPQRAPTDVRAQHTATTVLPGTEFDELVVGRFLHVEQMGPNEWWLDAGGVHVNLRVDRDGNPIAVAVDVYPRDGVTYRVDGGRR